MADGMKRCGWEYGCDHERFGDFEVCACHLTMESLATLEEGELHNAIAVVAAETDGFDLGVSAAGEILIRSANDADA